MKILLVDNSNTRTKFTLAEGSKELSGTFWIPTREISPESLSEKLAGLDFDAALICSVVPEKRAILEAFLSSLAPIHLLTHESPLGLALDYPKPASIGADRLANAVGVVARHGSPAVVIDFGTAVTFDVISAAPAYCGGVIAPGLGAMTEYLGRRTALLPTFELAEPPAAIGKSTAGAMQSGAVIGYRGLVKEILAEIRRELGEDIHAVATGGDAALIARGVQEIEHVDPDLTLHGLRIVAEEVFL
ncbi:type III pantothenate kinase [Haloferula chungangensis]|uniref:Type III pantothenate kinase n=1 Tax=Haloferula chungangensis TaxID=1048331 RepID=A0ABW2L634_9BACT